jgi:hypothetical protein
MKMPAKLFNGKHLRKGDFRVIRAWLPDLA